MGTHIKALLLIALLFLAITFGTQNSGSVTLRYYFDIVSVPLPLYLVIYLALILGIISGLAIDLYSRMSLKRRAKQLGKANESLRGELDKLKSETGEDAKEKSDLVPAESGPDQTQVLPSSPSAQTDGD